MRCLLFVLFSALILSSCSKSEKDNETTGSEAWLTQKKSEFSECTCLIAIYQGKYLGKTVYEIRVIDPLCNGVNIVYRWDGTTILHSGNQQSYQNYLNTVENLEKIWSCK